MATPIGTLGTIPTITIGGRVFTDLTNLITCYAYLAASSAIRYSVLRRGTAGYQVTSGKTYKLHAAKWNQQPGAPTGGLAFGYGDTDTGMSDSTGPTNKVVLYGTGNFLMQPAASASIETTFDGSLGFAATKYPYVFNDASTVQGSCSIYGYEV